MTRDEFAAVLNGREYTEEMTREDEGWARASRLLVIFGASDDLTEFRGVLHDEAGAYDGEEHEIFLHPKDGWEIWNGDDHSGELSAPHSFRISAKWCPDGFEGSWLIETSLPHSTFDIMEDGEIFCRGVVIDEADMLAAVAPPPDEKDLEIARLKARIAELEACAK